MPNDPTTQRPENPSQVLLSARTIRKRVGELGAGIAADYAGKELVLVGVLTGAVTFLADLIRHIDIPLELDFVAAASYGRATSTSGEVRLLKDLSHPIEGKHVLLVEDIVDTGLTLRYLMELLQTRCPATLASCALLDKPSRRQVEVEVKYTGFQIEDQFVVGYGLDAAGFHRNLPHIAILNP